MQNRPHIQPLWRSLLLCCVLGTSIVLLGFIVPRGETQWLWPVYFLSFGAYLGCLLLPGAMPPRLSFALGIVLRVALLFAPTLWSDDIYRFIWDGRSWLEGIHPFLHTPDWFAERGFPANGLNASLYARLNSPQYYTVYPPVAQGVFALSAWLSPNNIFGSTFIIKLFLLSCEVGTLIVLGRFQSEGQKLPIAAAYALNPLVILEGCGNGHFEVGAICFLLWAIYFLRQKQRLQAAVFISLAIGTKLTPLLFLPLIWRFLGFRKGSLFLFATFGLLLLMFLPLLNSDVLLHMGESIDLYFRQFQFNASLYYIFRWIGYRQVGFDIGEVSGPALALATALIVLLIAIILRPEARGGTTKQLTTAMMWASFIHLSLAAVVHPWYIIPLFGLSLLSNWRFPMVWTVLVVLSYSHYSSEAYTEQYTWIILEYTLLWAYLAWEISSYARRRSHPPYSGTTH